MNRDGLAFKEGIVTVTFAHTNANDMIQRFAMYQVNNDNTLKEIWINLHMHAADLVDKLTRRPVGIVLYTFTEEHFTDLNQLSALPLLGPFLINLHQVWAVIRPQLYKFLQQGSSKPLPCCEEHRDQEALP